MHKLAIVFMAAVFLACDAGHEDVQAKAQAFIDGYTEQYLQLAYQQSLAEWELNTHIVEGDSSNAVAAQKASRELAAFTGSKENIEKAQSFLQSKEQLAPLQIKQLESILYAAADNPQTVPELVEKRIAAETEQTEDLFGFDFTIDGKSVTTNRIDEILRNSDDLQERLEAWRASKEVGKVLKPGVANLRDLRNQTVQALGYRDFFSYQVSDYGMTVDEMLALMDRFNQELRPLFRELHTYARYTLAERFDQPVPEKIPAHWLPNRWGQDWSPMIKVEGYDLDQALAGKSPEWIVEQAERFYVSLGFDSLPPVFWEKSSLYPLPEGVDYKKNNHASAWHLDLQNDIRSLMSVTPTADWYETTHHELGHIYYYICYTNDEVPPLLREGANRAYHEAIGSLLGFASMQKPFLREVGLLNGDGHGNEIQTLLKEAMNYVVFIPWSAGVMTHFEHELYSENLPIEQFNQRWWEIVGKYQGIAPPQPRGEEYCDAASKTHINNDPAQYYDYAFSYILLFQLHHHIATEILGENPRNSNYYGNEEVGEFLAGIMTPGASRDWRVVLKEKTGEDLSAKAMLEYFEPLMAFLKEQNKNREAAL